MNLLDVNDPPVIFDQTFSVEENSANGTVVGTVAAIDPDFGDSLSYAIVAAWGGGIAFAIDNNTGELTVTDSSQLDYETAPMFFLGIRVTDSGLLTDFATITINVNPVNDAPG